MKKQNNSQVENVTVKVAKTNVNMSFAQANKFGHDIAKSTHTLNKACKVFAGIMSENYTFGKDEKAVTKTVGEWLKLLGIKGLNFKSLSENWAIKDKDGKFAYYRNVPGTYMDLEDTSRKVQKVYTYDSKANKYKTVTRFQLVSIPDNGWSAEIIMRGLVQGVYPEAVAEKVAESEKAFTDLKNVCVFDKSTKKGSETNHAKAIDKAQVRF